MKLAWLPIALLLAAAPVAAERADRDKPAVIDFDKAVTDDLNQVSVFTGKVRLTQGTLVLTGERMEVRKDPEGYASAVVLAPPGGVATYRERLDPRTPGVEETAEAQGDRIEYDERSDTLKIVGQARVKTFEAGQPRDEASGDTIVYNMLKRTVTVDGKPAGGDGRGRLILPPKSDVKPTAAPTPLKAAPATGK
ncbi:MAG: lipopolysaccharide transport periplasmic protein LptA [Betaproteobacteria bacterium]